MVAEFEDGDIMCVVDTSGFATVTFRNFPLSTALGKSLEEWHRRCRLPNELVVELRSHRPDEVSLRVISPWIEHESVCTNGFISKRGKLGVVWSERPDEQCRYLAELRNLLSSGTVDMKGLGEYRKFSDFVVGTSVVVQPKLYCRILQGSDSLDAVVMPRGWGQQDGICYVRVASTRGKVSRVLRVTHFVDCDSEIQLPAWLLAYLGVEENDAVVVESVAAASVLKATRVCLRPRVPVSLEVLAEQRLSAEAIVRPSLAHCGCLSVGDVVRVPISIAPLPPVMWLQVTLVEPSDAIVTGFGPDCIIEVQGTLPAAPKVAAESVVDEQSTAVTTLPTEFKAGASPLAMNALPTEPTVAAATTVAALAARERVLGEVGDQQLPYPPPVSVPALSAPPMPFAVHTNDAGSVPRGPPPPLPSAPVFAAPQQQHVPAAATEVTHGPSGYHYAPQTESEEPPPTEQLQPVMQHVQPPRGSPFSAQTQPLPSAASASPKRGMTVATQSPPPRHGATDVVAPFATRQFGLHEEATLADATPAPAPVAQDAPPEYVAAPRTPRLDSSRAASQPSALLDRASAAMHRARAQLQHAIQHSEEVKVARETRLVEMGVQLQEHGRLVREIDISRMHQEWSRV